MLTNQALEWLKTERPQLFSSSRYGTLDIEKTYNWAYYIWPKVYCLIGKDEKARIKGVSNNSMVVDESIVIKYKWVNKKNEICSRAYTNDEIRDIYQMYNQLNNKVKDNYEYIFKWLINKQTIWLL